MRLLAEAAELGCRAVQFIGGEPTLHPALPRLIARSRELGYEHVEVYTNATHLPPALLDCFVTHEVSVAVSVYGDEAALHDAVTTRPGSHRRTVANLKRLVRAGLAVRGGVIAMDSNRHRIDQTARFLTDLGLAHVAVDEARGVGRGADVSAGESGLQALCGACWQGRLCGAPDGGVSPCIMSKGCTVGSAIVSSLADIVAGDALRRARALIQAEVWAPRQADSLDPPTPCPPKPCDPDGSMPTLVCPPSDPGCVPKRARGEQTGAGSLQSITA